MNKKKQTARPAKSKKTENAPETRRSDHFDPRIIAFVCKWCSDVGHSEDAPGEARAARKPPVRFVNVMCSGRVQPSLVLRAFELGADGVIICGCEPGTCHYYFGNERQAEMFETSRKLISLLGLGEERLRLEWVSGTDGRRLGKVLDEFTEKVRHAGPSPLQKTRRNR
jgi:F420-non-reducing hydrogenase iron-sulfur subunit